MIKNQTMINIRAATQPLSSWSRRSGEGLGLLIVFRFENCGPMFPIFTRVRQLVHVAVLHGAIALATVKVIA